MLTRVNAVTFAAAVVAGMWLAVSPVLAQSGVTKDELKCESGTGKTLAKFVKNKSKCVSKCFGTQRKTSGPYADCFAPYGGLTLTCVTDPTTRKGAEEKAEDGIVKGCTKDCPECYAASTCSTGEPNVGNTESLIDAQGPSTYCIEAGAGTPTKDEGKCEDGNVKALVKMVGGLNKCYSKCNTNVFNGKIPEGSCAPGNGTPDPTDVPTRECLAKALGKCAESVNKACFIAPAVAPACYDGTVLRPNTGAGWCGLVKAVNDSQVPGIACGSPSGAFLN
jgi:hypothetical protein